MGNLSKVIFCHQEKIEYSKRQEIKLIITGNNLINTFVDDMIDLLKEHCKEEGLELYQL